MQARPTPRTGRARRGPALPRATLLCAACALLTACAACDAGPRTRLEGPVIEGPTAPPPSIPPTPPMPPAPSRREPPPPELPDVPADVTPQARAALARATRAFGVGLLQTFDTGGDVLVSPASLHLALTLTWGGARGETAAEMARALHLDDADLAAPDLAAPDRVHGAAAALLARWNTPGPNAPALRIASRLFADPRFRLEQDFLALARRRYGAGLEPLDLQGDLGGAVDLVNEFVSVETRGRIPRFLDPRAVDASTRLLIVNAVHLLARWAQPFEPSLTRPRPFRTLDGGSVSVPTMRNEASYGYASLGGVRALELPYEGGDLSMVILLPQQPDGLQALVRSLDLARLEQLLAALAPSRVAVELPRFEIAPPGAMELGARLQGLGMRRAFDRERAELEGIASPPDPRDRLFVAQVFHQGLVRVDEVGTEAAAASAVLLAPLGAMPAPATITFRADHPFVFLIRDRREGELLFAGWVTDPR